ncbi:MAG: hypothetical protein SWN10_01405 [Pseudomonadota bacterium]|nr:hypothetical protein [Alteromonas sp.]MDY6925735.1 hypothetical protein [Pseudomonadota bacterium]
MRIDPEYPSQYPSQPIRDGLKGWALLSYNIDASPKRIFDHEARRALAK